MAERDQLARPLRRLDARELRRHERVALRQRGELADGLRRDAYDRPRESGLPPTSTIRTSPASSTWESSLTTRKGTAVRAVRARGGAATPCRACAEGSRRRAARARRRNRPARPGRTDTTTG